MYLRCGFGHLGLVAGRTPRDRAMAVSLLSLSDHLPVFPESTGHGTMTLDVRPAAVQKSQNMQTHRIPNWRQCD